MGNEFHLKKNSTMPVFNDTAYCYSYDQGTEKFVFPSDFTVGDVNSPGYLVVTTVSLMSADTFHWASIMFPWGQRQREDREQLSALEPLACFVPVFALGSELLGSLWHQEHL